MDKVRLAIVGCGSISQLNAPGYLSDGRCEIIALCDPIEERAERRAAEWGIAPRIYTEFDRVLDDPEIDAVELLTPTNFHASQSIAALDAGKHVSCQKPMCNTVSEADQVISAASKSEGQFRVTENFLYYPPLIKAKELLDSGAIGEPSMARVRSVQGNLDTDAGMTTEPDARVWRRNPEANAGGFTFDAGWHHFATMIWLLGDVEKVFGTITRTDDYLMEMPSAAVWKVADRDCLVVFDHSNAPNMTIRGDYYPVDESFEIQGPNGFIWVTRCTGKILDLPPLMLHRDGETTAFHVDDDWAEGFNGAAHDFIDSIINGRQAHMDAEFSKKTLQTALALYRSSDSETAIDPRSLS